MHILFIASEIAPFSQMSEWAERIHQLSVAFKRMGHEVLVLMPRYGWIDPRRHGLAKRLTEIEVPLDGETLQCRLYEGHTPENIRVLFIDHEALFGKVMSPSELGGERDGLSYGLFARSACEVLIKTAFRPDVIQIYGWQGALFASMVKAFYSAIPQVAGIPLIQIADECEKEPKFSSEHLRRLGMDASWEEPEELGVSGGISHLKGGFLYTDAVVFPSVYYAEEIKRGEVGCREFKEAVEEVEENILGLLEGIDLKVWDPSRDEYLPHRYEIQHFNGKRQCKALLQQSYGFPMRPLIPVVGLEIPEEEEARALLEAVMEVLLSASVQVVIRGEDWKAMERWKGLEGKKWKWMKDRAEERERLYMAGIDLWVNIARTYAHGDALQKYMRYGAVPVVFCRGAAKDLLLDREAGHCFEDWNAQALEGVVREALDAYKDQRHWRTRVHEVMGIPRSWGERAQAYLELYQKLQS